MWGVQHNLVLLCNLHMCSFQRSGEEGCYPDLTLFCEKRIEHLAPGSRVLRKDKPAATAADFTAEEWETINDELMVQYDSSL